VSERMERATRHIARCTGLLTRVCVATKAKRRAAASCQAIDEKHVALRAHAKSDKAGEKGGGAKGGMPTLDGRVCKPAIVSACLSVALAVTRLSRAR